MVVHTRRQTNPNGFNTRGYDVHIGAVNITDALRDKAFRLADGNTINIFNTPLINDDNRSQVPIDTETQLTVGIRAFIQLNYPQLQFRHPVLLISLPGCGRQQAHTDYNPSHLVGLPANQRPGGILLALQDNTTFDIWPQPYTRTPVAPDRVLLNSGDVIVFRGDTVHAGTEYETANVRLHAYLDSDRVTRPLDRTWLVSARDPRIIHDHAIAGGIPSNHYQR